MVTTITVEITRHRVRIERTRMYFTYFGSRKITMQMKELNGFYPSISRPGIHSGPHNFGNSSPPLY